MKRFPRPRHFALFAATSLAIGTSLAAAADTPKLEQVANFEHQVTGVTVSKDGRIFVNFPRWSEDAPVSVGEVKEGRVTPYPDGAWNNWRNEKGPKLDPAKYFVCVQSVVIDPSGALWAVDAGAPGLGAVVKNAPKLVKVDLAKNEVAQVIPIGEDVALTASYLNDIRFSPDGKVAYLTDSGAKGALIVVDLDTGKARRLLDGHPSTQFEPDVVVTTDGGKPVRRPDGRGAQFAADGIALSEDGRTLYWQALTGKTLYKIATNVLTDAQKSPEDVAKAVEIAGENGVNDGLFIHDGKMYLSALEDDAIKVRDLSKGGPPTILLQDKRLRWPDTFSVGPGDVLYVTTSHIQDSMYFDMKGPVALPTQLWKVRLK